MTGVKEILIFIEKTLREAIGCKDKTFNRKINK